MEKSREKSNNALRCASDVCQNRSQVEALERFNAPLIFFAGQSRQSLLIKLDELRTSAQFHLINYNFNGLRSKPELRKSEGRT